jgi:hypothetical protein
VYTCDKKWSTLHFVDCMSLEHPGAVLDGRDNSERSGGYLWE